MAINTPERRRAVIDFGKITGTGMPIPPGAKDVFWRAHVLSLYPGIAAISLPFIGWRNRVTTSSFWRKATDVQD